MPISLRIRIAAAVVAVAAGGAVAIAQLGKEEGRIGPDNRIQPSGRLLNPAGKLTPLGNLPAGAALTPNGRFLWTVSAGRGLNDVRIVEVNPPRQRCERVGSAASRKRCAAARRKKIGRVVQVIPLPGSSGGVVIAPDGRSAWVAGTPAPSGEETADDLPGKDGDVLHAFTVDRATGTAQPAGVIELPPPDAAPTIQDFPPAPTTKLSWPRDIAVSRDGKTLLVALNLADHAAIVDTASKAVRYVAVGSYPYGAAITRDGKHGLVSNEVDGTVSVIDLAAGTKLSDIQVGPHLSHPEGIAADPRRDRAYVAVTHQDIIAVIDTDKMAVERTLSVERPAGIGTAPVSVSVDPTGCRLLSANSGEDAIAVFALSAAKRCFPGARTSARQARAERVLEHEGRLGVDLTENSAEEAAEIYGEEAEERAEAAKRRKPARKLPKQYALLGRVPVASYPVFAAATPKRRQLVWVAAKGLGVGPNDASTSPTPIPEDPGSATSGASEALRFRYLPGIVDGMSGVLSFPGERRLRKLTPRASRQIRPVNAQKAPAGSPIAPPGPSSKIKHVFYIVRENRTYDQVLGDDPRGDGDPKLALFGKEITPNAHALAERFPLLDHVYANSEASIDGHFWTSAANVSDYVTKNWHQNYGGRQRPYDFGVYAVTWPSQRFLFDRAEKQGISWFNFGEAIAGTVPLADRSRNSEENAEVAAKFAKSDLGQNGCFPNDASSGGVDVVAAAAGLTVEVYDSSLPPGAKPGAQSRFTCFQTRFNGWLATGDVPQFVYLTVANDHTSGTTPGMRTPRAMIAENDYALGQFVEAISNSPIWKESLILVVEDDSQDGADHVDAHRIPAFAISPYAKRGAVIHTRYDFLSFIRTLEIAIGMEPLNLFDATAVPMYDVFTADPENDDPYTAIPPNVNLTERNTAASPNAKLSASLPLQYTDRTPQRYLDKILWQYVHGLDSQPPPPGPNSSGLDEARWKRGGAVTPEQAREALLEGEDDEAEAGEGG